MDYREALEKAVERFRQGLASKIVHPFIPFPISVGRDGRVKIGFVDAGMTVEQFTSSKMWRIEE
jgi:hypothetical protein